MFTGEQRALVRARGLFSREAVARDSEASDTYGASVGRVVAPFHWSLLPDIADAVHLASFFSDERVALPVVHMVSKALPQRCQYRNLNEICATYCCSADGFVPWLLKVLLCSLGGYYPHCCAQVPTRVAAQLVRGTFETTRRQLAAWVRTHTPVVFYVLKELVTVFVRLEPALHHVLCNTYHWAEFEKQATETMDKIRSMLRSAPSGDVFASVHVGRLGARMSQTRCVYKAKRATFVQHMQQAMMLVRQRKYEEFMRTKEDTRRQIAQTTRLHSDALRAALHGVVRNKGTMPHVTDRAWLRMLGATRRTARLWSLTRTRYENGSESPHATATTLQSLEGQQCALVNYYVQCLFNLTQIKTAQLPPHWLRRHTEALGRTGAPATSYVCPACRSFKGFVVRDIHDKNFCAMGYEKVMIDDADGTVWCARRQAWYQRTGQRRKVDHSKRKAAVMFKQLARSRRRADEQRMCAKTRLVPVTLSGNALMCYGKMYTLCMTCAKPCAFDMLNYHGAIFQCPVCFRGQQEVNPFACFFCGVVSRSRRGWYTVVTDENQCLSLCRRHAVAAVRRRDKAARWSVDDLRKTVIAAVSVKPPRTR